MTWSSCYWNVLVLAIRAFSTKILIMFRIQTIAEFSKMIGYHQPADEQPDACGSFVRATWDDNSELAGICKDWGRLVSGEVRVGKWGHGEDQERLYWYPVFRKNKYCLRVQLHNVDDLRKMECDDSSAPNVGTNGDFWRVFVR